MYIVQYNTYGKLYIYITVHILYWLHLNTDQFDCGFLLWQSRWCSWISVPQFHISCHSFKKLLEGFSWKRILRRFVKTTIDNWGESNTVVPDFTLSVHYSSCNYQFCWASFLLLTLSMYLFLRVPKAGWDARK